MRNFIICLLVSGLFTACSDDSDNTTRVSFSVKDAPVDNAEAVVITFTGVELLQSGGDSLNFALESPMPIDLLSLQGTNSALLVDGVEVEPAVYSGVRLHAEFENANCQNLTAPFDSYIRIDGTDYPLILPSGELKIQSDLTIATGGLTSYVVDFDLRKSIAERGQTGCYNLRPVLRVVDTATTGSLSGTVDGALLSDENCSADGVTGEGAAVYLYAGAGVTPDDVDDLAAEPLTSALLEPLADGSGDFRYEIGFLLSGDYTAAFTCNANLDNPDVDDANGTETDLVLFTPGQSLVISADQETPVNFVTAQ